MDREIKECIVKMRYGIEIEYGQEIVRCKDCEDACICSDDWVICTHIDSNGNDKHPTD